MLDAGTEPTRLRLDDRAAPTQLPFISVIVPVRNEAPFIGQTLSQLCGQAYDRERFEVIVADGESTDATREVVAEWAERYANIHFVTNPKRRSSSGRNAALDCAQGELIVVVDGHCELDGPTYLQEVADAFARSGADCLGRPQPLDVTGATPLQRAIAVGRASRLGHHPASHIYSDREGFVPPQSVATAYRRSVFTLVGLFDECFDACEDVEFNHRVAHAGLRCFFTPRVQVHYHPRATLAGLFGQMMRYGRGRVRLLRKHPDSFTVPGFLPALWVMGLAAGPVASWFSPLLAGVYLGVLALYAVCVLAFSLYLGARERSLVVAAWLPLVYGAIHLGAGGGLCWEAVQGRRFAPNAAKEASPPAAGNSSPPRQDWIKAA